MPDIATLIEQMQRDGHFATIARNPLAQFGTAARRYIGAELLPERLVEENAYREQGVRYRTVIANAGTRYSPAQKKGADLVGDFLVELGDSDIARELTGREYDALVRLLGRNASMEAMAQLISWADTTLNRALVEYNEKQRWDAIVTAQVVRRGDNGYTETVNYANPTGHRVNAGGQWSDDNYDPWDDIMAGADLLASKGYTVDRIVTSRTVASILARNQKVAARAGVIVATGPALTLAAGRASLDAISAALVRDGLPPLELYDLQYRTQTGTGYFLARNVFVMVATTGRDETVDAGDNEQTLSNTLGYLAVGRPVGQPEPGRVIRAEFKADKPPRIEGEAWQTSLPVITEPEAIYVIGGIS
ncbi:MAG: major capsid protein [Chloroflexi bacterium]|nr:major capsid protein [Chloroflexota bacterium]